MKKYIFITLNLCAMNGADMYIFNKKKYLESRGYDVFVFSGVKGNIFIGGLSQYKELQSGYFRIYPGCFRKGAVERKLGWIAEQCCIKEGDEVIVESTNIISAMWAELLAKKLNCRHLFFILTENVKLYDAEKSFCRFKLERHEYAGISEKSVSGFLEDDSIQFDDTMKIRAFCTNTVQDCEDTITGRLNSNADLTIGSIGRLDKPYVMPLVTELSRFFSKYPQNTYNLVMIGGARSEKQEGRLKAILAGNKNLNCVFTGPLFPIPTEFVNRCDLFISASGSANATYKKGKATINLNPNTGGIIGIIGMTYQIRKLGLFDDQYPLSDLDRMIRMAIDRKDEIEFLSDDESELLAEMNAEFDRQLRYADLDNSFSYYDTFQIKHQKKNYRIFNVLGKVMSGEVIERSMDLMRRLFK